MPTVPHVTGQSVELQALPNARLSVAAATPEAFGAGMGRQLAQAGQAGMQYAIRRQEQEDADAAMLADAALKGAWSEQQRAVRERRGQAAWGAAEDTRRWVDDAAKKAGGSLTTDNQRRLYRQSVESVRLRALEFAGRHEDEQRRESLIESAKTRITADTNLAASDPTPAGIATSRRSIAGSVAAVGKLNGWDADRVAFETQNHVGAMHLQVLQALVEHNPLGAEGYFATHKADIPGAQHAEVERVIKIGSTKLKAQAYADEVAARGMPEADAIKAVRERFKGDEENTIVTAVKGRYSELHTAKERAQSDAAEQAWSVIERGGSYSQIPTKILGAMDPRSRESIQAHLRAKANDGGVDRTRTDWALYAQLRQEAADDPQGFAAKSLVQHFDKLAPTQREQLLDVRGSIVKQANKPAKAGREAATLTQQMNATMAKHGIKKAGTKGYFLSFVQSEVDDAMQANGGKPLTFDQRQQIIDRAVLQGPHPDRILPWGEKHMFELTPDQRSRFQPNVPADDRGQIIEALRAMKRPVTDENIRAEYLKGR